MIQKTQMRVIRHTYLKDRLLIDKCKATKLLDTWFDILCSYCSRWLKGEKPKLSENFEETKQVTAGSSDTFQDFIDSRLTVTDKPEDKVGKNKMHQLFIAMYPTKHLTVQQVIYPLKEKGIPYDGYL